MESEGKKKKRATGPVHVPIPVRLVRCDHKTYTRIPPVARMLLPHLAAAVFEAGGAPIYRLEVPMLPPSLNHQKMVSKWGGMYLSKPIRKFREVVKEATEKANLTGWKPTGKTAVMVILSSLAWVQKDGTIRPTDLDNRLKALLDAISRVTPGFQDHSVWEIFAFKQNTLKDSATVIYIFDLGDLVPTLPIP